jgi:4-hydroxy-tetrahydrodipicolinate synthase
MTGNNAMKGVVSVVNTPFNNKNQIDLESLKRYVDHSISCNVRGFLVPAMAAEVHKLSFEERKIMVKTVIDRVNGEVPVIGGASSEDTLGILKNAHMLNELGCDGILVSVPFNDKEIYKKTIFQISETNPGFLMIQDWEFKGYGIPLEIIVELFEEIDIFKHLKVEVVPAGLKYSQVIEATKGELIVSGGWASSQMIEGLDRGVNAFMSTILPDLYAQIYELHQKGEREAAKKAFYKLVPVLAFSHQHIDISIHFNKRMLYRQGIFNTANVREPIIPFDKYHIRVADELIDYALSISKEIKNKVAIC